MKEKQFLDKHYKRLRTEAVIRAVIFGLATACTLISILAITFWMLAISGILIGLAVGITAGSVSGILMYFLKYKPTDDSVARRIDRYGLEERMITMLELREDTSYIASLQRADAQKSLEGLPEKRVGYKLSVGMLILTACTLAVGIAFTVLCLLAQSGKIPYGKDILSGGSSGEMTVIYIAGEGGYILGEDTQKVSLGEDTSSVRAVADEGWMFVRWDDGEKSPERYEKSVSSDIVIKAVFEKIDVLDDSDDESDAADDIPSGAADEENGSDNSDEEGGENPENGEESQGGGKWQDKNQFIDGATYYRDYLELYYQYAMNIFESEGDIPADIIEFFETYFSGI